MSNAPLQAWAELLRAIAALLWPIFAFAALFLFRPEVRSILKRIKKGKLLGQELELQEELDRLESSKDAVLAAMAAQPAPQLPAPQLEVESADDVARQVLREAAESPKGGLLLLSAEIERTLREILLSNGWAQTGRPLPLSRSLELLAKNGSLPASLLEATRNFYRVRNEIAHGIGAASEGEVLRAVYAGTEIYRALTAVPHATHTVLAADLALYGDPDGQQPHPEFRAVLLSHEAKPGRGRVTESVHPIRPGTFRVGQKVSWHWNMSVVVGESWYQDPNTGKPKYAWTSSALFDGRPLA
jgi:hypothetical protein